VCVRTATCRHDADILCSHQLRQLKGLVAARAVISVISVWHTTSVQQRICCAQSVDGSPASNRCYAASTWHLDIYCSLLRPQTKCNGAIDDISNTLRWPIGQTLINSGCATTVCARHFVLLPHDAHALRRLCCHDMSVVGLSVSPFVTVAKIPSRN